MFSSRTLFLALLPSIGLAGCGGGDGGGGGTEPDPTGSVRVVAAVSGTGVAGAGFTLSRSGQSNRNGTSGADGSFTFSNLATGTWTLAIAPPAGHDLAPGQPASVSVTVVGSQTTVTNVALVAQLGTITAGVLADGSPRAGVTVRLFDDGAGTERSSGTTGADGTFAFAGLPAGAYDLEAVPPAGLELSPGEQMRRDVTLNAGGSPQVTFQMRAELGGTVVEVSATGSLTFTPADITISPGTTVRWTNTSSLFHTVTPDGHSEWSDADLSGNGSTFVHTFDTPGTYEYFCSPHQAQNMTGVIRVQ
jgi:plastocyanin